MSEAAHINDTRSISYRVRRAIALTLCIKPEAIRDTDNLQYNLGTDSLDKAEIIQEIEAEFGHSIPAAAAAELYSVQDIIEYIAKADLLEEFAG